ncbi:hypothetical protein [Noviluteimonas gilva]|uniref:VRR-NUC domain-containing protein n=1 Tax=Noviluteimonas gilva TaxID=2682097 RepID=A0A7C9I798_9GAMM|nr:hypothetical protein [Lysobacter gilvus]MUV15509.1 hypothetical protein [Lysobacter gilvus]
MTRDEVNTLVSSAIDLLFEKDRELLHLGVCERAMQFRLAHYLAQSDSIIAPLTVDCEYNRHFEDEKRLTLRPRRRPNGQLGLYPVLPDVLIHERNSDANNILALEIKKPGEPLARDSAKLRQFVAELHYRHAAHVIIGLGGCGEVVREIRWVE